MLTTLRFKYSPDTDAQAFFRFLTDHYRHIICRKALFVTPEEATDQLREDCAKFGVTLVDESATTKPR